MTRLPPHRRRHPSPWRYLLAATSAVLGVLGALYVGIDLMLVGGIVGAIHAAHAHPVDVSGIVWNSVRAACCGFAWLIAYVGIGLAVAAVEA